MATKEEIQAAGNAALGKFFSQETGKKSTRELIAEEIDRQAEEIKNNMYRAKRVKKKEVFSFRSNSDLVVEFRAYCEARYRMTADDIATEAMLEYIKAHPLEKYERDVYETRKQELLSSYEELEEKRAERKRRKQRNQ